MMVEVKVRKCAFLREVVRQLGLTRASVENCRLEELLSRSELHEATDVVTVRAEVAEKHDRGNRVTLKIECLVEGKRVISGEAEVVAQSRGK